MMTNNTQALERAVEKSDEFISAVKAREAGSKEAHHRHIAIYERSPQTTLIDVNGYLAKQIEQQKG